MRFCTIFIHRGKWRLAMKKLSLSEEQFGGKIIFIYCIVLGTFCVFDSILYYFSIFGAEYTTC